MEKLVSAGRAFYAIGIIAFGLEHLVYGTFVTRVVPYWPASIPGLDLWAYATGLLLVVLGGAILFGKQAHAAAIVLGTMILLSVLLLYVPLVAPSLTNGGLLTSMFKAVALCGGAFVIARSLANYEPLAFLWIGRLCFGSFLILAGVLHFVYRDFVATLVPAWIPGSMFWTYFAGVALIAGGAGINIPRLSKLAAMLSGAMIFIWVFILHIPRAAAPPHSTNELTAVFEALAFSGIAFVLAGSARGADPRDLR